MLSSFIYISVLFYMSLRQSGLSCVVSDKLSEKFRESRCGFFLILLLYVICPSAYVAKLFPVT